MKLAIVGARNYQNYQEFESIVSDWIYQHVEDDDDTLSIVSGGARGADSLAERFSKEYDIDIKVLKPDWNRYQKIAGLLRNTDIVAACDQVLAFVTPESRGTWDTIRKARAANKPVFIFKVKCQCKQ